MGRAGRGRPGAVRAPARGELYKVDGGEDDAVALAQDAHDAAVARRCCGQTPSNARPQSVCRDAKKRLYYLETHSSRGSSMLTAG